MATKKSAKVDFEKSLEKLDTLVEKMEAGSLSLEDSLKQFETGVKLIRECQTALTQAQQKVKILTEENGKAILADFATDEDE